ncbi:N-acetylglucosamine-1-phosphodiester alpha-N-acetylglucosaminidase-like isoform X2 [Lineus longissimus]|uniref:N-acetylglucosamine-1-phosphodiester alpha-N-acetylglucosaminidase-like isoform X2 n=1 Tax=Lineus longissimus TaxID=88925 RepID=UPI00315DDEBD
MAILQTKLSWNSVLVAVLIIVTIVITCSEGEAWGKEDWLLPYNINKRHGSKLLHRQIRDCQHIKYKNVTHELFAAHGTSNGTVVLPIVTTKYFRTKVGPYYHQKTIYGHISYVNNPKRTLSVIEPGGPGGCANHTRETVKNTAKKKKCIVSTNAGFFNTKTGACLGNVFSEGKLVQSSNGIQNAHFGITQDGKIFVGYMSEADLTRFKFANLVGGVIWLVRRGESYVDESMKVECQDTEETGTLQRFVDVVSARTSIGHDKFGKIIMVTVEGKTDQAGVNLREYADFLIKMGVYNAINLDGGGSASMVLNGTTINYPSDECSTHPFVCDRKITTIVCAHEPECRPSANCSGHGNCVAGRCVCRYPWTGAACDVLKCASNCSGNGDCTADGCACKAGWAGSLCDKKCSPGSYGVQCNMTCSCANGGKCDPADGSCDCKPGWSRPRCELPCPHGHYGAKCRGICYCPDTCICDAFTGACNETLVDITFLQTGACLAKKIIKKEHLVRERTVPDYNHWVETVSCISVVAVLSIVLNILLMWRYILCRSRSQICRTDQTLNSREISY